MIGQVVMIVVFLVLGIILWFGKGGFLISGFNTLSEEEKSKYDIISLSRFMSKIMFCIAAATGLSLLSKILSLPILSIMGFLLIIVVVIFSTLYLNTENRFLKD